MAAIVLSAAASSVASALGGGAVIAGIVGTIGAYAGGLIDQSIFGTQPDNNREGPRISDLMVQVSTYGKVIPVVYGTVRIAGNVIWAQPIAEHAHTSSYGGGKGGGGRVTTTTTSYTYTVSLAIAICSGPIKNVIRIWADSKEIDMALLNYTLYLGDESQLPDTFISTSLPRGQTPGYRGIAYIVIKDFSLTEFGNRIPNFTFEVHRQMKKEVDLEDKITEITLIPGAGEYVYDTLTQEKVLGQWDTNNNFLQSGKRVAVNMHNLSSKANVLVALDQLKANLPNVKWVSVVINWFANSLDPARLIIQPGIEWKDKHATIVPDEWRVAGYTRETAYKLLHFADGSITYGGTPTDKSILHIVQELKKRGFQVLLYCMLQVDTISPQPKPWRGRIKPKGTKSGESDINNFFRSNKGYNNFILHYATLSIDGVRLRDNIDGFMIGSEFVGLTHHMISPGVFPAVNELKNLAAQVRQAVGDKILIAYGADWSEYHSNNGCYNMDPLWSDPNIDIVAIDCYFPLTNDLPQDQISYQDIYDGWKSGEGWDYYYKDSLRTKKIKYSTPTYAWKNIKHWWSSFHKNPNGTKTSWIPKMKPLWLAEIGFASVDGCSNQPNVFIDPSSSESMVPRGSEGNVDFLAQRTALDASLDYLNDQNKLEPNLFPRKFIWTWDARPYPHWPNFTQVWADGRNWPTGHWIQGKLGISKLSEIVANLLQQVGFDSAMYDVSSLDIMVHGFVITNRQTVRASLEQLAQAYFFNVVESNGILKFVNLLDRKTAIDKYAINADELVVNNEGDSLAITRLSEVELPSQVDVVYLDTAKNYQPGTVHAQRQTIKTLNYTTINLPIALSAKEAKLVADFTLYNALITRTQYQFIVPPKYAGLEPTDVITITKNHVKHHIRVTSTKLFGNKSQLVTGVARDILMMPSRYNSTGTDNIGTEPPAYISKTKLSLLDLPLLPTDLDSGYMHYAAVGLSDNWKGAAIYVYAPNDEYYYLESIYQQATIGTVLGVVQPGNIYTWDTTTSINVTLIHGELESVTEAAVLSGANTCVVGQEIIQFQTAKLVDKNNYILSNLLRGRLGTEWSVTKHQPGEEFILLNNAVAKTLVPVSYWNIPKQYKPVTLGSTVDDTSAQGFTYTAKSYKPYAPVHIVGSRNLRGDIYISWKRRTRALGEWRDNVDVPLAEESERYEIDIDSSPRRTIAVVGSQSAIYTEKEQIEDFGSVQKQIKVTVYQLSTTVGRGYPGTAII